MLNYISPVIGSQPVSAMLPPAVPGTMPSAVPGVMPSPSPLPPQPPIKPPHIHQNHGTPHSAAIAAILKHAASAPGVAPSPPPPPEYGTTTQEDGSILLHLKGPDGSLGPVVKVIPPIKTPGAAKV